MRKPLSVIAVVSCILLLAGSLTLAGPRGRDLPSRYLPGSMDGRLDQIVNSADGREWSTWAYRNGAEYDIAVSYRDDLGYWSEPILIGQNDGLDQAAPVLTADSYGTLYLAYAERSPERVMLTWLPAGSDTWAPPQSLTAPPGIDVSAPELMVVADRLVVAFRAGRGTAMLAFPLVEPVIRGDIFNDGPDPVESRPPDENADEDDDTGPKPLAAIGDTGQDDDSGNWENGPGN